VNDRLTEMNVNLLDKVGGGKKNFDVVQDGDVVILPAFGASFEEMEYLDKKVRTTLVRWFAAYQPCCLSLTLGCNRSER
jgi:4-hydroxy-3-methylbut-2-enyl diphosphate reductase IspH